MADLSFGMSIASYLGCLRGFAPKQAWSSRTGEVACFAENSVPRINQDLLKCVFYLYETPEMAASGERSGGTGFLVGMQSTANPSIHFIYAVTNRHVVLEGNSCVLRFNRLDGRQEIVESNPDQWICSNEHDLAIAPVPLDFVSLDCKFIPHQLFATRELAQAGDFAPGDEVFMIGRFVHHDGKQANQPSVRFGNLSMMQSGMQHPYYTHRQEDSFAVDLRSYPGYSGSPVFLKISNFDARNGSLSLGGDHIILLGINWGFIADHAEVNEKIVQTRAAEMRGEATKVVAYVNSNTGINGVVPAWHLLDLLNHKVSKFLREAANVPVVQKISGSSTIVY